MDTPTSQGDNRYSYPNTTLESINKIHNAYAIDHNLGPVLLGTYFSRLSSSPIELFLI